VVLAATDYPFLNLFWTMLVFFGWIIWIWLLISVFTDLFRRTDISGWAKAGWLIFVIVLPYLGVFIYLITQSRQMAEHNLRDVRAAQTQFDEHVKSVAGGGGAAAEIEKAKQLLDTGAITQPNMTPLNRRCWCRDLAHSAAHDGGHRPGPSGRPTNPQQWGAAQEPKR
jgi:Phospholipase_D-nuclease N-terminal